jgi:hypothetical protein
MLIFLLVARAIPNGEEAGVTDLNPTITYADDKSPVLPLVDLKVLPPKVVTELLEAFVKAAWSKLFILARTLLYLYLTSVQNMHVHQTLLRRSLGLL